MAYLFLFIFLLSIIILIIGIIKPSLFQRLIKITPKRKTIALFCSAAMVISFLGILITVPEIENDNSVTNNSEPESTTQITNTETNEAPAEQIIIETINIENDNSVINNSEPENTIQMTSIKTIETPAEQIVSEAINTEAQNKQDKLTTEEKQIIDSPVQSSPQYEYYSVSSVVDGDTLKVNINGTIETLRLIGMDTPETVDPRKPVQCFGIESSNKAKELLIGKKIRIEKDPTQGEIDRHGRRLVFVYREDGLFFNKHMIEQGYAHEYTHIIPYKYQTEFKAAQKSARENLRGLWSPDTCNGETTSNTDSSPSQLSQAVGKYYTSSFRTSKYYYPVSCDGWKSLSLNYLRAFDSVEALLSAFPSRVLNPRCQ